MNNQAANKLEDLKAQCKPDPKKIFNEVKQVAVDPVGCWNNVRGTYPTIKEYYLNFLAPLALVPAVIGFINNCIVGISVPVINQASPTFAFTTEVHRLGIVTGIIGAIIQFAVTLAMLYVFAFILGKVAAKFGGTDDVFGALKLAGYSRSPAILATVLTILPMGTLLAALVSLYCIYIFYQGISPMLSVPADKRLVFTAVSVVACFVAGIVIVGIVSLFGVGAMMA